MSRWVKDILGRYLNYTCECCDISNHYLLPAGDRIYEDDHLVIYSNLTVPLLGFIVIAPKKHVGHFSELDSEEYFYIVENISKLTDALRKFKISSEFTILKVENDNSHCKIWVLPYLEGIFENDFDFSLLENRYSMERRKIPVATTYDILYLNRRLRTIFEYRTINQGVH